MRSLTQYPELLRTLTRALVATAALYALSIILDPTIAHAEPLNSKGGWGGGVWSPLINVVSTLLQGLGTLGMLLGLALKAVAGPDEMKHALSHRVMGGAAMGLMVGLLAVDISNLFMSWVGI